MQIFLLATFVLRIGLIVAFSIKERHLLNQEKAELRKFNDVRDCITMHGDEGDYRYLSSGQDAVCGLYFISKPDTTIDIVFQHFDVDCDDGALVALVDGWEAKGEFFPGEWDSWKSLDDRYLTYCGRQVPRYFRSSQNAALIQLRIPQELQGFIFTVRFVPQNRPCSGISMGGEGVWTIKNFGQESNCSFSLLTPQYVQVMKMDVGTSTQLPEIDMGAKPRKSCPEDRLEFLGGVGLDPSYMWLEDSVCGRANLPRHGIYLPCPHNVVRLASSGLFENKVTFRHRPLTDEEKAIIGPVEC